MSTLVRGMRKRHKLFLIRRLLPVALAFHFSACSPVPLKTEERVPVPSATPTRQVEASPTAAAVTPTVTFPVQTPFPAQTQNPATPSPTPCAQSGGQIQKFSLNSAILENDLEGRVYLPPCYGSDDGASYPVLYLLHGVTANDEQWISLGVDETMDRLITGGVAPPFIIVMPRESSWGLPPDNEFGRALVQELLPWVDRQYRTRAERDYRAIGGLSRGGNWALHIGSREWRHFSAMGGHSAPVFFGDARDIPMWLDKIPEEELPRIYLDIGEDDQNQESTLALEQALTEQGFPHDWHLYPGTHNEAYWQEHVEAYIKWYAATWREDPAHDLALPDRAE